MPRRPRVAIGGIVYHVLNRANARTQIFTQPRDYELFEQVLAHAHERVAMRTVSYCLMPNHWHLVLWPRKDGDLSTFMRWVTLTHTQRRHSSRGTPGTGHLYQGRFKSFPIQSDGHYLTVCRYVERNALQARLVSRAEDWRWCSLWRRTFGEADDRSWLNDGPVDWPEEWISQVNCPQTQKELDALNGCIERGRPFGNETWMKTIARRLGLTSAIRPRGRPRKKQKGQKKRRKKCT